MQPIFLLALCLLAPALSFSIGNQKKATRNVAVWIESPRITNWGTWQEEAFCPENTTVTGFRLKNHPDQGPLVDDTSANSIELVCRSGSGSDDPIYIRSGEAGHGTWGTYFNCLAPARANGFELQHESIAFDNTAVNNLALYCDGSRMVGNGNSWGNYSGILMCLPNQHICGFRLQIAVMQPTQYDDTGLNNVDMACCTEGEIG